MIVQPTIGDVARIIYRRKWSMLFVALLVTALGAAYLISAVPLYRSTASIVVRFGRTAVPATNLARDATPTVIDTNERRELIQAHADIITSPDLAQLAIDRFGLAKLYPTIADEPPARGTLVDAAIKRFAGDLFVSPELAGNVITIGFSHADPQVARAMLDTLIEAYMQRESEIFSGTSFDFQKSQADLAAKRLVGAQTQLTTYKAAAGVSDFDTQLNALIKQHSDLNSRLQTAQVAFGEANERRSALTKLLATVPAMTDNASGDKYRQVDDSQSRVNALRAQEREMIASHGLDWPPLRALRASIDEAASTTSSASAAATGRRLTQANTVYQSIQLDLLRATSEAQSNQQAVALMTAQDQALNKRITDLEAVHAGLIERQREVELADSAYRAISMQLADSRIDVDRLRDGISRVALITKPNLPYQITTPRYRLTAMATAGAAVLAGLFFGFMLEFFDDRVRSPQHVTARLNVPVLATFDKA